MKLTRKGQRLLTKVLAGELELHFTRFGLGSGEYTGAVYDLEDLVRLEMWLPLVSVEVIGDGTAELSAYLSNAEVVKGFAAREHGLFATDETGAEILFSYRNVGGDYDYIPANTGSALKNLFITEVVEVRDAAKVTATLDLTVAYISREEFTAHLKNKHPHPNTPNHYAEIESTTALWATDLDNHLHQISIENLKKILKESPQKTIGELIREIGNDYNLLIYEDFTGESVLDELKIKVTSSAANSNLIGVAEIEGLETGSSYVISDGIKIEEVVAVGIIKDSSGYHIRLEKPLANSYNGGALYRTSPQSGRKQTLKYEGETFSGVKANIPVEIGLNLNGLEIIGDGFVEKGYLTLG